MSIHPSLAASKSKKHRSVLKRFERIQELKKSGKWQEGNSIFSLPKSRIIKIRLKKAKAAAAEKSAAEKTADSSAASAPAKK